MKNSKEVDRIASEMLTLVDKEGVAIFTDFARKIEGFAESPGVRLEVDNVVFWCGLSLDAAKAFRVFWESGKVTGRPISPLPYRIDGEVVLLPIGKAIPPKGYKAPHWVPMEFIPLC